MRVSFTFSNKEQFKIRNFKVQSYFSDLGPGFSVADYSWSFTAPVLPLFRLLCCFSPLPSEQSGEMINPYRQKVCRIEMSSRITDGVGWAFSVFFSYLCQSCLLCGKLGIGCISKPYFLFSFLCVLSLEFFSQVVGCHS